FGEAVTDLDIAEALQFQLGGAESEKQIPDKGNLRDYWIRISLARDFLDTAPSHTSIRDSILRLCHRLITCSIAGRSQAPEKVLEVVCCWEEEQGSYLWMTICMEIDDTWAWVALGSERQPDAAGTLGAAEDALVLDEGGQAVPAPVQAPSPPLAAARTMP
ncbi:hypothetical protein Tco_1274908, partial [Tanacetum coccineum]